MIESPKFYEIWVYDIFKGIYKKMTSLTKYKVGKIINGEYQVREVKDMESKHEERS